MTDTKPIRQAVSAALRAMSTRYDIPYEHCLGIAKIESALNPFAKTGSYKGLFQLDDVQFAKHYRDRTGDIYNPMHNALAAGSLLTEEAIRFRAVMGREPTAHDRYMVHQQGMAGYTTHLKFPEAPAWLNFKKASKWPDKRAKQAIWGNMTPKMKSLFSSVEGVTSGDFTRLWKERTKKMGLGD